MKILLNPDSGAPITDYTPVNSVTFFTEGDSWKPGNVMQFEDDIVANRFLENFQFLVEITPDEAKVWLEAKKLTCGSCDFVTRKQDELDTHMKTHAKAQELSELGIPVIRKQKTVEELQRTVSDLQRKIDSDAETDGLTEGTGLTDDRPVKNVIMS